MWKIRKTYDVKFKKKAVNLYLKEGIRFYNHQRFPT
jgi:hypothetical protein